MDISLPPERRSIVSKWEEVADTMLRTLRFKAPADLSTARFAHRPLTAPHNRSSVSSRFVGPGCAPSLVFL